MAEETPPMSPSERVAAGHEELHERILSTAEELLVEDGPDRLSVRGIARRMGYAPASLYHYFADKDAIIAGVLERGGRRIGAAIRSAAEAASDPLQALRDAFTAYVNVSIERPALARLVYLMRRPAPGNLRAGASHENPNLSYLASILRAAQIGGQIDDLDVDMTVRCLWAAAQGLVIRLALDEYEPGPERDKLVGSYVHILMNGIVR